MPEDLGFLYNFLLSVVIQAGPAQAAEELLDSFIDDVVRLDRVRIDGDGPREGLEHNVPRGVSVALIEGLEGQKVVGGCRLGSLFSSTSWPRRARTGVGGPSFLVPAAVVCGAGRDWEVSWDARNVPGIGK